METMLTIAKFSALAFLLILMQVILHAPDMVVAFVAFWMACEALAFAVFWLWRSLGALIWGPRHPIFW